VQAIDFFPGEASVEARAAWADFNKRVESLLSPDEPHETKGRIPQLDAGKYQGRTWAHAASPVGRSRGQRLADSPFHRSQGALSVSGQALGLSEECSGHLTSTAPRSRTSADHVTFEVLMASFVPGG